LFWGVDFFFCFVGGGGLPKKKIRGSKKGTKNQKKTPPPSKGVLPLSKNKRGNRGPFFFCLGGKKNKPGFLKTQVWGFVDRGGGTQQPKKKEVLGLVVFLFLGGGGNPKPRAPPTNWYSRGGWGPHQGCPPNGKATKPPRGEPM